MGTENEKSTEESLKNWCMGRQEQKDSSAEMKLNDARLRPGRLLALVLSLEVGLILAPEGYIWNEDMRALRTWSCDMISVNSPPGEGNWATRGLGLFVPFSAPSGESIDSELWLLYAYLDGWRNLFRFYLWIIVGCSSVTEGRSIDALSWSWMRRRRARRLNNIKFKGRTWVIYNQLSHVICGILHCNSQIYNFESNK